MVRPKLAKPRPKNARPRPRPKPKTTRPRPDQSSQFSVLCESKTDRPALLFITYIK